MKIPFHIPTTVDGSEERALDAIRRKELAGDHTYTRLCSRLMEEKYHAKKVFLTTSGTDALEMAALLCGVQAGDEVIMPSFTFTSTATAFAMRGAKIVFVDIRPDTQNIDENLIESAITEKTKVIVPVHYAGVSCEMDSITALAARYSLLVVEDAAQGVHAFYKNQALGTFGNFGCYSFHETKNYTMGEGGAILINRQRDIDRADIIRQKGTNRTRFLLGLADKYTWVDEGSSYLPSDINAAYLYPQMQKAAEINQIRLERWERYYDSLSALNRDGKIELPVIPPECAHNAHMFYIKTRTPEERDRLMIFLREHEIASAFHYIPLHSSPEGLRVGRFSGQDRYTTDTSRRLLRLPMYTSIQALDIDLICGRLYDFYFDK